MWQGMTLDYVKVSLGNIFAPGQAYVALSRARSLEGLQVSNVDFNCVKVDYLASPHLPIILLFFH